MGNALTLGQMEVRFYDGSACLRCRCRHLMFALRETSAADNNPEPGRQYLRDTFGQGYWGKREGF
ncbi:MAG: hypothetical protein NT142_12160, partial [Planctomycetota bacterium]|nr:hypothetical protein [Planctomycetota bacterium]